MHDQTRRSRGEVHIRVSVVWDGMVKEVVVEIATMNISVRHLIIATVIRRLCWQIPDLCFYTTCLHTQGDTASRTHSILMYVHIVHVN